MVFDVTTLQLPIVAKLGILEIVASSGMSFSDSGGKPCLFIVMFGMVLVVLLFGEFFLCASFGYCCIFSVGLCKQTPVRFSAVRYWCGIAVCSRSEMFYDHCRGDLAAITGRQL